MPKAKPKAKPITDFENPRRYNKANGFVSKDRSECPNCGAREACWIEEGCSGSGYWQCQNCAWDNGGF